MHSPINLEGRGQGVAIGRQEGRGKWCRGVGDCNYIVAPECVSVLGAHFFHRLLRLLHVLAGRRVVARILVLSANVLACDPGNGIFHAHVGIFADKKLDEIDVKSFRPQNLRDCERGLGKSAKIDIDANRAMVNDLARSFAAARAIAG